MILGAALLLTALCLFLVFRLIPRHEGGAVQVKSHGHVIATYSLSEEHTGENAIVIKHPIFEGENVLEIHEGKAYVRSADCKDGICMRMGPISQKGEQIICLPNELFIRIISGEDGDADAIVQ